MSSNTYQQTYARWKGDPIGFWEEAAGDIDWFSPPTITFRPHIKPYGRWFTDGRQTAVAES